MVLGFEARASKVWDLGAAAQQAFRQQQQRYVWGEGLWFMHKFTGFGIRAVMITKDCGIECSNVVQALRGDTMSKHSDP